MRLLTAHDHAASQGIGEELRIIFGLSDIGEALLKDLAGNAFSGNVCVSMLLGVLVDPEVGGEPNAGGPGNSRILRF